MMAARSALVIGAGLAGHAMAYALAKRQWSVQLLDGDHPDSSGGSWQPVLAQHPSVTPDDAPMSRLCRVAVGLSQGPYDVGVMRWTGRLQLCSTEVARACVGQLPKSWVQAVDARMASSLAGIALNSGGLWLPQAGSAAPTALCSAWTIPGIEVRRGIEVASIFRHGAIWQALDSKGRLLGEAPHLIVAAGACTPHISLVSQDARAIALGSQFGLASWQRRSAHSTLVQVGREHVPACILGGDGHALATDDEQHLLLGPVNGLDETASNQHLSTAQAAWQRYQRNLFQSPVPVALHATHTGTRLSVRDHLPLAGQVPDRLEIERHYAALHRDARQPLPRLEGLWISTAFGGRGLLWSILCAELIASQLDGTPAPIEARLAASLDPGRFIQRDLPRATHPEHALGRSDDLT
jgi:tRNA 5-methylaminomethyl-2-thiouridine biosynthesis bifunctional protein